MTRVLEKKNFGEKNKVKEQGFCQVESLSSMI